jgi:hypothetical protein
MSRDDTHWGRDTILIISNTMGLSKEQLEAFKEISIPTVPLGRSAQSEETAKVAVTAAMWQALNSSSMAASQRSDKKLPKPKKSLFHKHLEASHASHDRASSIFLLFLEHSVRGTYFVQRKLGS